MRTALAIHMLFDEIDAVDYREVKDIAQARVDQFLADHRAAAEP